MQNKETQNQKSTILTFTKTEPPEWLLAFWKEIDDKTFGKGFDCFVEDATCRLGVAEWNGREVIRKNLRAFIDTGFTALHHVTELGRRLDQGLPGGCHHDAGRPQPGSSQACDDPLLLHGPGHSHQSPQLDWVGGPGGVLTQCHGNRDREVAKKSAISHQRSPR
jgi:hypothetical protein